MTLKWDPKDPDEVLDYQIDWSGRLKDDTIQTSIWIVPPDITKNSDTHTDTTSTIWLSGGTEGLRLSITCRITTAGGRTMDQSVQLQIKAK